MDAVDDLVADLERPRIPQRLGLPDCVGKGGKASTLSNADRASAAVEASKAHGPVDVPGPVARDDREAGPAPCCRTLCATISASRALYSLSDHRFDLPT